jgi:hypothetical protein
MAAIGKASEVPNRILRGTSGIVIDQRMIPLIAFPRWVRILQRNDQSLYRVRPSADCWRNAGATTNSQRKVSKAIFIGDRAPVRRGKSPR